jgi:hypothetical protein
MLTSLKKTGAFLLIMGVFYIGESAMIKPNPIISRGTGAAAKVSGSGDATGLNNNKFGPYETKTWKFTDNSWAAINVVSGTYSKVFITWNCPDTTWSEAIAVGDSCKHALAVPVDYKILTSANSTTGDDGNWTAVDSVNGNNVGARGHLVNFTGAKWIKMAISKGSGKIDEIEVFDASNSLQDSWFFLGTRFTAFMMKDSLAMYGPTAYPDSIFANLIKRTNPTFTPAVIRGGIQCSIKSADVVRDISKYLSVVGNVHFWAIEIGLYDAWGGKNDGVADFKKNLQIIVDSCKAHGIQAVISTIPATTNGSKAAKPLSWQVHNDFYKAVDSITTKNQLIAGADFYYYFTHGPSGMGYYDLDATGTLPNADGDCEAQKVWAQKMDSIVYKSKVSVNPVFSSMTATDKINMISKQGWVILDANCAGTVSVFTINGELVDNVVVKKAGPVSLGNNATGLYVIKFKSEKGTVQTLPILNR